MLAEIGIVEHVYNIVRSIRVLFAQLIEDIQFDDGLVEEALLVPYDLDGHVCVGLVIQRLMTWPKLPLPITSRIS